MNRELNRLLESVRAELAEGLPKGKYLGLRDAKSIDMNRVRVDLETTSGDNLGGNIETLLRGEDDVRWLTRPPRRGEGTASFTIFVRDPDEFKYLWNTLERAEIYDDTILNFYVSVTDI